MESSSYHYEDAEPKPVPKVAVARFTLDDIGYLSYLVRSQAGPTITTATHKRIKDLILEIEMNWPR